MTVTWIRSGLREIKRNFKTILDDNAGWVIDGAMAELDSTREKFKKRQIQTHDPRLTPKPWGYRIYPEYPLCFKPSMIKGAVLWTDLYCTVLWKEEPRPVKQDMHLRVWSHKSNDCTYREGWDSDIVLDKLNRHSWPHEGRVMLRCHFDLADPGQPGPEYHLQFGGNPRGDELCWFPELINLPRLPYPPMDLVLLCRLIAANFHWQEYTQFRETAEWINVLRNSQEYLLKDYYEGCLRALDQDLLADYLWNPTDVQE